MKNNILFTKILAGVMAAVLITGTAGAAMYANAKENNTENNSENETTGGLLDKASEALDKWIVPVTHEGDSKSETVYVMTDASGAVDKVIVSDWLSNTTSATTLADHSELTDVKNVEDERTFTTNADQTYVWDAQGEDVYYQGTTDKELPVSVDVTYLLDGQAINPEDLAGKSGKVTMHFDYSNNMSNQVTIDGKEETLYTPFAMVTGMILDNSNFKNIEVNNGTLENDGTRTIVLGFGFPGLEESLQLDSKSLTIPDYVEVTADVEDFSLVATMTVATSSLFQDFHFESTDDLNRLKDSMDELDDAANQLVEGTVDLYEGLDTLLSKSSELISGIGELKSGSKQVSDGAASVASGAAQVNSGVNDLKGGLNTLAGKNAELVGGASQVFNTLLGQANTQIAESALPIPVESLTIDNYANVLTNAIQTYQTTFPDVNTAILVVANQSDQLKAVAGGPITSIEIYETIINGIKLQNEEAGTQADTNVRSTAAALTGVSGTLSGVKSQLDSYNTFYQGLVQYTQGVASANDGCGKLQSGAASLSSGAATLSTGAATLDNGIGILQSGGNTLVNGVTQLRDGSITLRDGMAQFYEDGISKLMSGFDITDGQILLDRLKALGELGKEYNNFSGIKAGMEGSVKFIIETGSID